MRIFPLILACFATMLASCSPDQGSADGPVVLAPSSMTEALEAVADEWERQGNPRPVLSFSGTPALARQIEQGAPADIVITADSQWMDWLAERDLVDAESRRDIAGNSLVLIMLETHGLENAERIAIAEPESVPAGRYAKRALEDVGLWQQVEPLIVPTENVRIALALVERGEADMGIVYASDARAAGLLTTQRLFMPDGEHILYLAAELATSDHNDASDFLDFLSSEDGAVILCEHGFTMPEARTPC